MEKTKEQLIGEIRYAVRLTQRTARLYRRIQTFGTFLTVLGGSAALAAFSGNLLPEWVLIVGALLFTCSGAALIAIRPADKAAMNDADAKRYQSLMVKAQTMTDDELRVAIEEARNGDAPEIEGLRYIAYNDVMQEINRQDQIIPLSKSVMLLRVFA